MRKHRLLLLAAMVGLVGVAGAGVSPAHAATEHCPDHEGNPGKVNGTNNDVVLPKGTLFCVKGSTKATGELVADGEKTLFQYLGIGRDVSYYVVYSRPDTAVVPLPPKLTPPTCDAPGEVTIPEKPGLQYTKETVDGDVVVSVKAAPGYDLDGDVVGPWTFTAEDLAQLTENCDETLPPPPKVDPPAVVDAGGPVPPAPVPAPLVAAAGATAAAPAAAPTALPATGSTSWALALSALAMVAGGLGLRRLSRRTDDSII